MKARLPKLHKILIIGIITTACYLLIDTPDINSQNGNASIYLSPSQGTFEVGNTFAVSVFVNTGGQDINAVRLDLSFPADKLQIVDPTAGNSFISIWITQPTFSNVTGSATFEGGLPSPGINTSAGLITTITFRAKSPGSATISVLNSSRVLANDGAGTDLLTSFGQGSYNLVIPAPEGPIITSSTHGDQNRWYRNDDPVFEWILESSYSPIEYSWSFDQDPNGIPDDEPDGEQTTTHYENIQSGIWYFHVKARISGVWGQTSHYLIRIDTVAPAEFAPIIEPNSTNPDIRRLISFVTSDQHSGIDHYEIKIENLIDQESSYAFFVEATSPWQAPLLSYGKYRVVVRAYDKAGNWYDGPTEFEIRASLSTILTKHGLLVGSFLLPWWVVILLVIILLIFYLIFLIFLLINLLSFLRKQRKKQFKYLDKNNWIKRNGKGKQSPRKLNQKDHERKNMYSN